MAEAFAVVSPYIGIASSVLGFFGKMSQADELENAARVNAANAARAAEANRAQLAQAAGQEEAASQHEAVAAKRKANLMMSRAMAIAAASGAGAMPENLAAGLIGEGETAAENALYGGKERATGLRYKGDEGVRYTSAQNAANIQSAGSKASALKWSAFGDLAKGGLSAFAPGPVPGVPTHQQYADNDWMSA